MACAVVQALQWRLKLAKLSCCTSPIHASAAALQWSGSLRHRIVRYFHAEYVAASGRWLTQQDGQPDGRQSSWSEPQSWSGSVEQYFAQLATMPKKGKAGKKGVKPEWMSEELYALSNNPAQLVENFKGAADKSSGECTVSREQVQHVLQGQGKCACTACT